MKAPNRRGADLSLIVEPRGIEVRSVTPMIRLLYVTSGEWLGWLCYRLPDGRWATLRKATPKDRERLRKAGAPA